MTEDGLEPSLVSTPSHAGRVATELCQRLAMQVARLVMFL